MGCVVQGIDEIDHSPFQFPTHAKRLSQIAAAPLHDPNQYVYVEILNSWSKKLTRLLLASEDTYMINGSISEYGENISYSNKTKLGYSTFATAVRQLLKDMALTVAEAVKTIKFAAVGARNLFDDENSEESVQLYEKINTAGFDRQVVSKFAAMGSRTLAL